MNRIITAFLIIWQFPQYLTSLVSIIFISIERIEKIGQCKVHYTNKFQRFGISFGSNILLSNDNRGQELLPHEYGHSIQSLITGPFYLVLIAIPSIFRFIFYQKKINKAKSDQEKETLRNQYFLGYPENWATSLGKKYFPQRNKQDA